MTGLIAVVYKLSAAFQTVRAALNAGGGLLSALSGGTLGAILAAVGAAASVITLITGGIAQAAEPVDYSERISTLTGHRDEVAELAAEYEELANTTGRTEAESARMNAILEQLSGSSMALHDALSTSTGGFVEQGEAIRDVNGYLAELEERINNLQRQEAAESFQDVSGIQDAQAALAEARENENLWREYQKFLESEAAQYTDFPTYVRGKIVEYSDVDHVQDQIYWAGLDDQLMSLADGWLVHTDELVAALDNLGLSAQEASANAADNLDAAWQTVEDSLHVFIEGPKTTAMPDYFRDVLEGYFDQSMAGIDREAEVTSEQLTAIAADLKAKQEELYAFMQDNPRLHGLLNQYEEELQSAEPDLEAANALIEQINEILASYNTLREAGEEPLPLLPELTAEGLQEIRAEAEAAGEALASLDTTDIYKGLAMAKEEANGFSNVLSRLGKGDGQLENLHDAVMETARAMADELGVTDEAEIVKIGEELLEGLYDTYPGIADYVDTATGMLLEGWKEGIAGATNPWAELFEAAKLEDALKAAKRDMAALEDSSLWAELLAPEGKGLYQYAEDWARALIPDGTMEEVQAQAQAFVEAFFAMFADIDASIMDADGRIATGMEGIVATMRQAAHDAQAEASKLETAYRSLHADSIAREEVARGLQGMMEYARWGDTKNVSSIFEGLSTQAIDAIAAAMPELIDKLMEGTYAAEDFEAALAKLKEAETEAGKNAWQDYFHSTADGLREQSALWGEAMRGIIAEVAAADDRAGAFYKALMRLSDEGLDVSGLLAQYGALAVALLDGSASAEELYASLARLGELEALQIDLEQADALSGAAKSIDPANESYDPLAA